MTDFKAILWDFGGVLTDSPFEAFNQYERQQGIPLNFIRSLNATNPDSNAWARFEKNEIDLETFNNEFLSESRSAGYPIEGLTVIRLICCNLRPGMVAALQECRNHFKNACLTNNVKYGNGTGMADDPMIAGQINDIMELFDIVVESSIEGIRKPDPRAYQIVTERLKIAPEHIVYLDDLGINLKPAAKMGMQTIKVTSESQALKDLSSLTGLDLL
jgi:putative hydrolase of the HAD superfamily